MIITNHLILKILLTHFCKQLTNLTFHFSIPSQIQSLHSASMAFRFMIKYVTMTLSVHSTPIIIHTALL